MATKQSKDNKNLYNYDYESREEKKRKKEKLKAKKQNDKALKKQAIQKKNLHGKDKKRKADLTQSASPMRINGQGYDEKGLGNEIIIGVTRVAEPTAKKQTKKQNTGKKAGQNKNVKENTQSKKAKRKPRKNRSGKEKIEKSDVYEDSKASNKTSHKKIGNVLKITALIILIVGAIVATMLSPIFNIKTIKVSGNSVVSTDTIKSLSGIALEENMFKIYTPKVTKNIKENAYIESVTIHRKLPDTIEIVVEERKASYMLEYGNGYVYVSNQGYMLEISSIKQNLPILVGTTTSKEDYKVGNRLNQDDLTKLGTLLKVMKLAQNHGIADLITKLDVSDQNNYTLYFETENKIAYLGDCSNLETRMLYLVGILEHEKTNSGEIFINMNLNTEDAFFRESV